MINLDNIQTMKILDKSNVYDSIANLANQCQHAYDSVQANKGFKPITGVKNIIMSGMGGSGLAARVIKPLFKDSLKVPIELINSYHLPRFVDKNSFVLVSSYSGNTEETLSSAYEALKRKAQIYVICSGGKLYNWAIKNKIPVYKIDPKFNQCGQPRMAIGYSIFGQLIMFSQTRLISLKTNEIRKTIEFLQKQNKRFDIKLKQTKNKAKQIAVQMYQHTPVMVASGFLDGAIYVTKNQINENAKSFAYSFLIPELNHHLMEGLKHPKSNKNNLKFLFYQSSLYQDQIKKRFTLTDEVVQKNHIKTLSYKLKGKTKLAQVFEVIQIGAYWQYYLTMLYGIDPAPIPWVDYFKAKL